VSEELGVFAEPEILSKALNKHDKFIIIASDGVFEFLTSQNVVNIVQKFDDPLEAAQALVEEAYNRWLQFEVFRNIEKTTSFDNSLSIDFDCILSKRK
jgi:serine/threonine protein phosphatase PrpC